MRAGQPALQHVVTTFRAGVPQIEVLVDRTKAEALGVSVGDVFATLSSYVGSSYVNQFNEFGRTFQVYVQADAPFRLHEEDILQLTVRSQERADGAAGRAGAGAADHRAGADHAVQPVSGRNDRRRAGAGLQLGRGDVVDGADSPAKVLPRGTGFEWTAMSYQEKAVGGQIYVVFGLGLLLVYLCLAAQYESWIAPLVGGAGGPAGAERAGAGAGCVWGWRTICTRRSGWCC